ncbi:hypothetical protein [Bosea sp. UNC402CLCol]|uniref:hypothetical protein n=1 Tax=Bosea sp. UNC402CLCol TaxID=1510531 RepID=UPI0020BEC4D5|nr:hypothetical protein [Bosea sp. UNC402CLCol]
MKLGLSSFRLGWRRSSSSKIPPRTAARMLRLMQSEDACRAGTEPVGGKQSHFAEAEARRWPKDSGPGHDQVTDLDAVEKGHVELDRDLWPIAGECTRRRSQRTIGQCADHTALDDAGSVAVLLGGGERKFKLIAPPSLPEWTDQSALPDAPSGQLARQHYRSQILAISRGRRID